jgi:hypothetical protein
MKLRRIYTKSCISVSTDKEFKYNFISNCDPMTTNGDKKITFFRLYQLFFKLIIESVFLHMSLTYAMIDLKKKLL